MPRTAAEQKLYDAHLRKIQEKHPEVTVIMDTTAEDADWMRRPARDQKDDDE
jgi:ribosomal protein S11